MKRKSSAYYQSLYRQRLREQGLVKKEIWILPEHAKALGEIEQKLRLPAIGGAEISNESLGVGQNWTAQSLYAVLSTHELFIQKRASVELLQGAELTLHIEMHEYGELPLFLAVSGEQIIVEGVLWAIDEVIDVASLNEAILRTHKLFPLSSIALEHNPDGVSYYTMYGALSASSRLINVILEIEMLADNIIKATEAYAEHLKESV